MTTTVKTDHRSIVALKLSPSVLVLIATAQQIVKAIPRSRRPLRRWRR